MPVEIERLKNREPDRTYPYFGQGYQTGKIVLFTQKNTGMIVYEGNQSDYRPFYISDSFIESQYNPIHYAVKIYSV